MLEETDSTGSANGEISFDPDGKSRLEPYVGPDWSKLFSRDEERPTYEQFRKRAVERDLPQPTMAQWAQECLPTPDECDVADARRDQVYEADYGDLCKYSLVRDFGGKPRVVWHRNNGIVGQMSVPDFKNAHREKFFQVGDNKDGTPKYRPLVDAWLEHPKTRRAEIAEFLPGRYRWEVDADIYNLWSGWPDGLPRNRDLRPHVIGDPLPEDDEYDGDSEPEECSLFLDHIRQNISGGDDEVFRYLLGWMAEGLLRPGHSETAVVMTGPSGSGKGTFAELYGSFFGPHYLSTSNRDHVIGKFNRHLMDCQLLFGDEIDFKSNAEANQQLRNLVTEPTMPVEAKGVDVVQSKKHFRVVIATNERHVVGALHDDRRFLVLEADAGDRNRDRDYFAAMRRQWYKDGGRVALFRWLTGRHWRQVLDTGMWDVGDRPETEALQEQKNLSLPPAEMVVQNMLLEGEVPCEFTERTGTVFVATRLLADARRLSEQENTALGRAVRVVAGKGAKSIREKVAGVRHRGFWLPPLELARANWERHLGRNVVWPEDVTTWAVEANNHQAETDEIPF